MTAHRANPGQVFVSVPIEVTFLKQSPEHPAPYFDDYRMSIKKVRAGRDILSYEMLAQLEMLGLAEIDCKANTSSSFLFF